MCVRGVRKKAVKLSTAGYFTTHGSLKMHCLDFGFIPGIEDTLSECRCLKMREYFGPCPKEVLVKIEGKTNPTPLN